MVIFIETILRFVLSKKLINITVCLQSKYQTKESKLKQYIMRYSEAGVQGFCPLPSTLCYNSSIKFPKLVRPLFLFLDDFFVPVTSLFTRIGYKSSRLVVSDMTLN